MIGGSAFPSASQGAGSGTGASINDIVAALAPSFAEILAASQTVGAYPVSIALPLRVEDLDGTAVGPANTAKYTIRQGNTAPRRRVRFVDAANKPVDLTGATIVFRLHQFSPAGLPNTLVTIEAPATILSASGAEAEYIWTQGDTDTIGSYYETWEITWSNTEVTTLPTTGKIICDIGAN